MHSIDQGFQRETVLPGRSGCAHGPAPGNHDEEAFIAGAASNLLESIADSVEGLDHIEFVVRGFELLAQPLDVAVDGAVVPVGGVSRRAVLWTSLTVWLTRASNISGCENRPRSRR